MKSYPSYIQSGYDWIGEFPTHWRFLRFKNIVNLVNEKENGQQTNGVRLSLENVEGFTGQLLPSEGEVVFEGAGNLFRPDDVLFGKLRPYLGKVVLASSPGTCVGDLLVVRPKTEMVTPKFLFYRLISKTFIDEVNSSTFGTKMPRASWEFIGNLRIPFPSVTEQQSITSVLDDKTRKIDDLIEKKGRLIELLKEQRTAIINQAVTKGLDPNVRMKDSGIEWIGEIPEHWATKNLKYVTRFVNGAPFKPSDWMQSGTPIIRIENLNGSEDFNYSIDKLDSRYEVKRGDLLFAWSGNRGTSFGPYIWNKDGLYYLNQHIFRLENYSFDKMWLYWALKAVTTHVESQAHGIIGLVHITKEDLGIIPVPCISLSEQQAIAAYLDDKTRKIDDLIEGQQRLVDLLREQRTAIISEVVTGKVDVRGELA
jgi:type I restriction enzyme S subunit